MMFIKQKEPLNSQLHVTLIYSTWAVNKGPIVFGFAGTHAGVESRLGTGGKTGQGGRRWDRGLKRSSVGTLNALAFACVTGVSAPTAARLVQALSTGSVARAVFSCTRAQRSTIYYS